MIVFQKFNFNYINLIYATILESNQKLALGEFLKVKKNQIERNRSESVQSEAGLPMLENQLTLENAFLSGQITNTTPILKE
jgi:hypothetical protein